MRRELIELFGRKPSVSLDLERIPPLLREYVKTCSKSTDCHPGLLITAWLPHIAVNFGNRVFMLSNSARIYPNVWSCLLGPSSVSRKTTALTYAGYTINPHETPLEDAPLDVYEKETLRLSNVTYSKMLSMLALNGTRLFIHHELSAWLAEMNKHFNSGYKQTVTELYDGVSKTVSNQTKTERIVKPALSIATATTEAWMYRNIRENSDQLGGFLQRFIYFVVRDINIEDIDLGTREGEDLEELLAIYEDIFRVFRAIPGSHRVRMNEDAVALRDSVYREQYRTWFAKNNDELMSYFTRIYDGYFYKFCAIFTLVEWWEELGGLSNEAPARLSSEASVSENRRPVPLPLRVLLRQHHPLEIVRTGQARRGTKTGGNHQQIQWQGPTFGPYEHVAHEEESSAKLHRLPDRPGSNNRGIINAVQETCKIYVIEPGIMNDWNVHRT